MVTEIAQIEVKPGTEKDFEAAVAKAKPLFLRAKGGRHGASQIGRKADALPAVRQMGDAGKPHGRFPRLRRFSGLARSGRTIFCEPA